MPSAMLPMKIRNSGLAESLAFLRARNSVKSAISAGEESRRAGPIRTAKSGIKHARFSGNFRILYRSRKPELSIHAPNASI